MFCLPIDFRNSGNNDYKNGNKCQRYVTFNVFKLHKLRFLVDSYTQNFDIRYKNICDLRFFERAFGAQHGIAYCWGGAYNINYPLSSIHNKSRIFVNHRLKNMVQSFKYSV